LSRNLKVCKVTLVLVFILLLLLRAESIVDYKRGWHELFVVAGPLI